MEDQEQDGHQPGAPEIADADIPPPAEKPEGDTVGTGERIHHTNVVPDAPESVEKAEEAITSQQDGERTEEESADVVVSDLKEFI